VKENLLVQWVIAALVSFTAAGCATGGAAEGPPEEYKSIGGIAYGEHGATFSNDAVKSPHLNASRRRDGSWGGRFLTGAIGPAGAMPIDANVYTNSLKGVDLTASWEETPTGVVVTAQVQGRILRFEVDDQKVLVRTATRGGMGGAPPLSFTLPRVDKETFGRGDFKLTGVASDLHPPEPQFALAMIAAFD
jgi:hypothetical protein